MSDILMGLAEPFEVRTAITALAHQILASFGEFVLVKRELRHGKLQLSDGRVVLAGILGELRNKCLAVHLLDSQLFDAIH